MGGNLTNCGKKTSTLLGAGIEHIPCRMAVACRETGSGRQLHSRSRRIHVEGNKVKASYNHAEYLPQRREMMQHWADYLDGLKKGAAVEVATAQYS